GQSLGSLYKICAISRIADSFSNFAIHDIIKQKNARNSPFGNFVHFFILNDYLSSSATGFFQKPKTKAEIIEPIMTAKISSNGWLPNATIVMIPPCGAGTLVVQNCVKPPATAAPSTLEVITRNGSAAANGIAPSVMNVRPIMKFVKPDCFSVLVNLFLNKTDAKAIANGGTIPPAITAAMNLPSPVSVKIPIEKA